MLGVPVPCSGSGGASNIAHHRGIMSFIQKNQSSEDADTIEL
jgi:hypothetical protein